MKNRILALLLIIIFIIATAVCSSAYSTDIPTLYVPETRCFRMALELPEQVGSGSEFSAGASVAKLYKGFDGKGITMLSGVLCYGSELFSVNPTISNADGYTVTVTPSSFTVTFKTPAAAESLTDLRFSISMNAKHVTDELMTSIERVYVYFDNVGAKVTAYANEKGGVVVEVNVGVDNACKVNVKVELGKISDTETGAKVYVDVVAAGESVKVNVVANVVSNANATNLDKNDFAINGTAAVIVTGAVNVNVNVDISGAAKYIPGETEDENGKYVVQVSGNASVNVGK